jgi:phage regulator Rha-like protein
MKNKVQPIKNKRKRITSLSSSLIIHGSRNEIFVDSRDIAIEFGRLHKNVLQTLDDLQAEGIISRLESKPRYYKKLGREYRCFVLNKAGFLKAMPFIGGQKSKEGQRLFVDEFLRIEAALERQSKVRETLAYQVARLSGKDSRSILTDEIKSFVAYAKESGSQNADRYFTNITIAVYKAMLNIEPQATNIRELLTAIQLSTLSMFELIAAQILSEGMKNQQPYKVIFQAIKNSLSSYVVERSKPLNS